MRMLIQKSYRFCSGSSINDIGCPYFLYCLSVFIEYSLSRYFRFFTRHNGYRYEYDSMVREQFLYCNFL